MKSKAYLKWLNKEKHCIMCGAGDVSPHHLRIYGHTRRHSDCGNVIPLCHSCHMELHKNPDHEREHYKEFEQIATRLWKEYENR